MGIHMKVLVANKLANYCMSVDEIFAKSLKIGALETFWLYGTSSGSPSNTTDNCVSVGAIMEHFPCISYRKAFNFKPFNL